MIIILSLALFFTVVVANQYGKNHKYIGNTSAEKEDKTNDL